jgi:hypothetical protein
VIGYVVIGLLMTVPLWFYPLLWVVLGGCGTYTALRAVSGGTAKPQHEDDRKFMSTVLLYGIPRTPTRSGMSACDESASDG